MRERVNMSESERVGESEEVCTHYTRTRPGAPEEVLQGYGQRNILAVQVITRPYHDDHTA